MQRIIEAAMKRSVLVIVSLVLILVWGGISAYDMQRDYLPPIYNSTLMVTVRADNYEADQVKTNITGVIEDALRGVNNLEYVETNSYNGGLLCSLYFPLNYDMDKANSEVTQALSDLNLPAGVQKPIVTGVSTSSFPIMKLSLMSNSNQTNENTLRTSLQNKIVNQLKTVPGVREVRVTGGGNNGYAITLRMKDLKKTGLTMEDVKRSLVSLTPAWPQERIMNKQISIPVRIGDGGVTAENLKELQIHGPDGKMIPLSSVADISQTITDLQTISRTDGNPSVILDVLKTPSSNITEVSDRVHDRLKVLQGNLPGDINISILYDRGEDVRQSLNSLIKEGLLGCVFSMLSVFLFLRNVRATVLIALSLPICLLATTGLLKLMGISLNILTVSGLVVAMGRVVDDSIVILDNMYRKVQEARGNFNLQHLIGAVREMIPAIVSSTATTITVFLPIILVGGYIRSAFSAFAWTVVIALTVSLLVSLLVVPALFPLLRRRSFTSSSPSVEPIVNRILHWSLSRRKLVVSLSILIFLITIGGAMYLPVNFLPTNGPGEIQIKVELPEGNSLQAMDTEVKQIEALLRSDTRIETFSATLGSSFIPQFDDVFDEGGGWIQENHIANLIVKVKPNVDVDHFIPELRSKLGRLPGNAICTVTNRNIAGDDSKLKVVLTGADRNTLDNVARLIRGKLQLVPGLSVEGVNDAEPRYQLSLNRDQIERSGVKMEDVLNTINQYRSQGDRIMINDSNTPVIINTDKLNSVSNRNGIDFLSLLGEETFKSKDGKNIPLKEFASVVKSNGPSVIREKDGLPFAVVSADIFTRDVEKVTNQTEDLLESLSLPSGVKYSFGGISEQVQQMILEMAIALVISTLLVLLIVTTVFQGWKAPLSVLVCIPFSISGSVGGMIIFGKEWNMAALIGIMMLVGIVVTNGIVLVDKIERNLAEGIALQEAILRGTLSRVRPVLMTACTTILTLLPLTLSSRADTVISQTLGIVVVGGMISSTIISLIVIPIIYEWMSRQSTVSSSHKENVTL